MLTQLCLVSLEVAVPLRLTQFVQLSEYDRKWQSILAKEVDEVQIDLHWFVAAVDKQHHASQLLSVKQVAIDKFLQLCLTLLAQFGIAVAWEVNNVPLVIYDEMVDEKGLAWGRRSLGETILLHEHIDQTRLTHVRPSDEGVLGHCPRRTLLPVTITYYKFRVHYKN